MPRAIFRNLIEATIRRGALPQSLSQWIIKAFVKTTSQTKLYSRILDNLKAQDCDTREIEHAITTAKRVDQATRSLIAKSLNSGMLIARKEILYVPRAAAQDFVVNSEDKQLTSFDDLIFLDRKAWDRGTVKAHPKSQRIWRQLCILREAQSRVLEKAEQASDTMREEIRTTQEKTAQVNCDTAKMITERFQLNENTDVYLLKAKLGVLKIEGETRRAKHLDTEINEIRKAIKRIETTPARQARRFIGLSSALAAALMSLVLCQEIGEELDPTPIPEDQAGQADGQPDASQQKTGPQRRAKRSAADRIRTSLKRRTAQKNQREENDQLGRITASAEKRGTSRGERRGRKTALVLPPTPRQEIERELESNPEKGVDAFEKALQEDSLSIRQQYEIYHTKIQPLLQNPQVSENTKAKIRQLGNRFHDIEVPAEGTATNEGILTREASKVGRAQTPDQLTGTAEDNRNLQFGKVLERHNYDDGYFAASIWDRMESGNIGQSKNVPAEPSGTLDREKHIKLSQNFRGNVQLRKTSEGKVDLDSLSFTNWEGKSLSWQRGQDYEVAEDSFGFVHLSFKNKSLRGKVIYLLHPMKNTATSREKAEKITEHYSQVQLQEPLQIPDNMRTQLESWQKLSPQRIAENLRDYLQENYVYSTAPSVVETYRNSSSSRENTFLREGVGDCNEFNQVFVTILRSYFHLPARLVEGSLYDLNLRNAHTWSEVFYEGSWHRFDATGSAPELGLFYNSEDAFDSPYYPYLQLAKLSPTPSNYFYLQAELAQIATELREAITSRDKGLELDTNLKRDAYSKRFFEIARSLGKGREAATSAVKNLEKILNSSEGLSSGYRDLYQQYSLGLFPEETPEKTIAEKILSFVLSKNTSNKRRAVLLTTINSYAKDHLGEGYLRNLYKNRMLALDDYARIALINLTAESSKSPEITREIATLSGYLKHHRFFFDKRLVSDFGQRNNKFLFDSLRRHGQTNRFFVALANYLNSKISNASARDDVAPLDRGYFEAEKNLSDQERNILNDLSTLSYLAYRTQGRDKRRACQRLFNKLSKINQKRWLFAMDRPWHFYIHYDSDMLQRHSLHMYAIGWEQHDSFLKMFSLHFMLRMEERQSAEIFRPHINEVYQTVRTEVDERTTSGRELDRLEFFALLWLARIDENSPRFLDLARQVAPRVLEQVQQQERINFSNLDLSTLQDLLYLDEDGTGMRIVSAMISKTRFSSFEEFWNFKTAYNSRTTSRTVARPESSVEMKKAFLELFVTLWQPEFDYLLEEWGSPQEIAEFVQPHLEQIPIDGYLDVGLGADLIHSLLLIQLSAELRGIPLDVSRAINRVINRGHFEGEVTLQDLLYHDLLSAEPLPPRTRDLYLSTLYFAVPAELRTEDFQQLASIMTRYPNNPNAIRSFGELASSPELDPGERPSLAPLIEGFLEHQNVLSPEERVLSASFLLGEVAVDTSLSNMLRDSQRLLDVIERQEIDYLAEDQQIAIATNLERFRRSANQLAPILYDLALRHPDRYSADLEALRDMVDRTNGRTRIDRALERHGIEADRDW